MTADREEGRSVQVLYGRSGMWPLALSAKQREDRARLAMTADREEERSVIELFISELEGLRASRFSTAFLEPLCLPPFFGKASAPLRIPKIERRPPSNG